MGLKLSSNGLAGHFHSGKPFAFIESTLLVFALFQSKPKPESIYVASAFLLLAFMFRIWTLRHIHFQRHGQKIFISGPYRLVQFPFFLSSIITSLAIATYSASFGIVMMAFVLFVWIYRLHTKATAVQNPSLSSFEYKSLAPKLLPSLLSTSNALLGRKIEKKNSFLRGGRFDAPIILAALCILHWPSFGISSSEYYSKIISLGAILLIIIRIIWIFGNQIGESFSGFRSRFRYRS